MNNQQTPKLAYSTKEAAVALSTSVSSIMNLIHEGKLHPMRIGKAGRKFIIPASQLQSLLDN